MGSDPLPQGVSGLPTRPGELEWIRRDRWHLRSVCGFYTVAKALIRGVASYGAWYRPDADGKRIPHHLGEHSSADDAKATCLQHHRLTTMEK